MTNVWVENNNLSVWAVCESMPWHKRDEWLVQLGVRCPATGSVGVWACICAGSCGSDSRIPGVDFNARAFGTMTIGGALEFIRSSKLMGTATGAGK